MRRDSAQAASSVHVTITFCASPVWRIRLCQLLDVPLAVSSLASRKCGHCPGRLGGGGEILVGLELSRPVSVSVPVACPRLASRPGPRPSTSVSLPSFPGGLVLILGSARWEPLLSEPLAPLPPYFLIVVVSLFLSVPSREATSRLYLGCSGGSLALSSVTSIVLLD